MLFLKTFGSLFALLALLFGVMLIGRYTAVLLPRESLEAVIDQWVTTTLRYGTTFPFKSFLEQSGKTVTDQVLPWIVGLQVGITRKSEILKALLLHEVEEASNLTTPIQTWGYMRYQRYKGDMDAIRHSIEVLVDQIIPVLRDFSQTVEERTIIIESFLTHPLSNKRFLDIEHDFEKLLSPSSGDYLNELISASSKLRTEADQAGKAVLLIMKILLEGLIALFIIITKICLDSQFQQLLLAYMYYELVTKTARYIFSIMSASVGRVKTARSASWEFDIWIATIEGTYPYRVVKSAHMLSIVVRFFAIISGWVMPEFFWYLTRNDVSLYLGVLVLVYSWREAKESTYMSINVDANIAVRNWKPEGVRFSKFVLLNRLEELIVYYGGIKDLGFLAWVDFSFPTFSNPLQFLASPSYPIQVLFFLFLPLYLVVDFLLKEILSLLFWTYRYGYLYPRIWNKRVDPALVQLLKTGAPVQMAHVHGVGINPADGWFFNTVRTCALHFGWAPHGPAPAPAPFTGHTPLTILRSFCSFIADVIGLFCVPILDAIFYIYQYFSLCDCTCTTRCSRRLKRILRTVSRCCCNPEDPDEILPGGEPIPLLPPVIDPDDPEGIIRGLHELGVEMRDEPVPPNFTCWGCLMSCFACLRCTMMIPGRIAAFCSREPQVPDVQQIILDADEDDPEGLIRGLRDIGIVLDGEPALPRQNQPPIRGSFLSRVFPCCTRAEMQDDYEMDLRDPGAESESEVVSHSDSDRADQQRNCSCTYFLSTLCQISLRLIYSCVTCCRVCCCCCCDDDDEEPPDSSSEEYVLFSYPTRAVRLQVLPTIDLPLPLELDSSSEELEIPAGSLLSDPGDEQETFAVERQPDSAHEVYAGSESSSLSESESEHSSDELPLIHVPILNTVYENYLFALERKAQLEDIRKNPSKFPPLHPPRYEYDVDPLMLGIPIETVSRWSDVFSHWPDIISYFGFRPGTLNPLVCTCRSALYAWIHCPDSGFEMYSEIKEKFPVFSGFGRSFDEWMLSESVVCSYLGLLRVRQAHELQSIELEKCLKSISRSERGDWLLRRILSEYPKDFLCVAMNSNDATSGNLRALLLQIRCTEDQLAEWYNWSVSAIAFVCDTIDPVRQREYFELRANKIRDAFVTQIREGVAFMNQSTRDFIERLARLHELEFRKVDSGEDVSDYVNETPKFSLHYENLTIAKPPTGFNDVAGLQLIGRCSEWHLPIRNISMDYLMREILNQFADRVDLDKYHVPAPTLELVHEGLSKYVPRPFKADFDETYGGISFRTWLFSVMDNIYGYNSEDKIPPIDPESFSADEHLTPNSRRAFPGLSWSQRKFKNKADAVSAAIPVAKDLQSAYALNTLSPHYWVVITVPKVSKREKPQVRIACAPEMHYYILNTLYLWDFVERSKVTPGRANFEPFFMHFHDAVSRLFSRTNIRGEQVDLVHQGGRTPAPVLRLFSAWLGAKMCIKDRTVLNSIIEEQINAKIILPNLFGGDVLRTRSGWKDGAFGTSQIDSWVVTSYHLWMLFRAVKDDPPSPQLIARYGPPLSWWKHVVVESHGDNWLSTHPYPLDRWLSWSANLPALSQLGQEATIVQGIRPERFELMGFRITPHVTFRGDTIFVGSRPPEKTVKSLLYRRRLYKDAERNIAYIRSIVVALRFTDSWNDISRLILDEVSARFSAGDFRKAHLTFSSYDTQIVELAQKEPSLLLGSARSVWTNRREELIFSDAEPGEHDVVD